MTPETPITIGHVGWSPDFKSTPRPLSQLKGLCPSDATACSSVEFRLLSTGDIIDPDDEFLTDDCQTWVRVGDEALKFMIGKSYSATFFQPMRRKTYPTNAKAMASADTNTPTPKENV